MPAPAPSRASSSLTLQHGMTTISVGLYAGSEDGGFSRQEYSPDGRKVGRVYSVEVDEGVQKDVDNTVRIALDAALRDKRITQEQYDRANKFNLVDTILHGEIVKCVDAPEGLVAISDEEIATLDFDKVKKDTAEILTFLPLGVLGTGSYVPDDIQQMRPKREKGRSNEAASEAFAFLLKGMRSKAVFALVRMLVRNKVKYGALMPTGRVWMLKYDDQVREDLPLPDMSNLDRDKLRGVAIVIGNSISEQAPALEDIATEKCWDLVKKKVTEGTIFKPNGPITPVGDSSEKVNDLMASLEEAVKSRDN